MQEDLRLAAEVRDAWIARAGDGIPAPGSNPYVSGQDEPWHRYGYAVSLLMSRLEPRAPKARHTGSLAKRTLRTLLTVALGGGSIGLPRRGKTSSDERIDAQARARLEALEAAIRFYRGDADANAFEAAPALRKVQLAVGASAAMLEDVGREYPHPIFLLFASPPFVENTHRILEAALGLGSPQRQAFEHESSLRIRSGFVVDAYVEIIRNIGRASDGQIPFEPFARQMDLDLEQERGRAERVVRHALGEQAVKGYRRLKAGDREELLRASLKLEALGSIVATTAISMDSWDTVQ